MVIATIIGILTKYEEIQNHVQFFIYEINGEYRAKVSLDKTLFQTA
jgi:hypothetical protein